MENSTVEEGKTMAIISYLWWIGIIIAFIMNNSKRNSFTAFHIRQMLGLLLLSLINGFVYKTVGYTAGSIIGLALFVFWIIGFVGAIQGQEKKIPLLGDQFQEWFKSI